MPSKPHRVSLSGWRRSRLRTIAASFALPSVVGALLSVTEGCKPGSTAAQPSPGPTSTPTTGIPPREQWEANSGYCGEVSMITAGLYFGQYVSQYDARDFASGSAPQSNPSSQLLAGVNDQTAAQAMHLNLVEWNSGGTPDSTQYLAWVKLHSHAGELVTISIYLNNYLFYADTSPTAGDPSYDHIVPVTGITSSHPLSDTSYYADDVIEFSDNKLWTGTGSNPSFAFSYPFGSFQATRSQSNATNAAVYSLPTGTANYGWAITGVTDPNHDTLPVRVDTDLNYEHPVIVDGSNTRPAAMPLTLTITVSGLQPGVAYKLYRYNAVASIPDSNFNASAASAAESWDIQIPTGTQYSRTELINSDEVAAYRAVLASAP